MIGHILKRNWVTPRIQLIAAKATCEISCSLNPKAPNINQFSLFITMAKEFWTRSF